jgi:imidazolonepropionase-like amidohydrolase
MNQMALLAACVSLLGPRLLAGQGAPGNSAPPDTTLVLRGGRYLDTRVGVLRPNGVIVVRNGRIAEMHPPGAHRDIPPDAKTIDLRGRTVVPGLIDAHVHLTLAGNPAANAQATLRAGFTTVVDLGSVKGAGTRLRDEIARGTTPGPKVLAAGSWIGAKGGVCEFGGATVGDAVEAGNRARADIESGADLLKVCITGWPADAVAAPDSVELGPESLDAVLEVARAATRRVYAHAIGQAGALLAAEHRVRALAHTPIVNSAGAARLKQTGVVVISTLATLTAGPGGEAVRRSFRLLRSAGVPIVLGTDAGVLPHGRNADELAALVEAGLTPAEAIRAATVEAAALLEKKDLGKIAVGATADLVVVDGDPLQDLGLLSRPALVLKGGRRP